MASNTGDARSLELALAQVYHDLVEIFEAQGVDTSVSGAEWWDERVTSGVRGLNAAARALGRRERFSYCYGRPQPGDLGGREDA